MNKQKDSLEQFLGDRFENYSVKSNDLWVRIGNKLNLQQSALLKSAAFNIIKRSILSYSAIAISAVAIIMSTITLNKLNKVSQQNQLAQQTENIAEIQKDQNLIESNTQDLVSKDIESQTEIPVIPNVNQTVKPKSSNNIISKNKFSKSKANSYIHLTPVIKTVVSFDEVIKSRNENNITIAKDYPDKTIDVSIAKVEMMKAPSSINLNKMLVKSYNNSVAEPALIDDPFYRNWKKKFSKQYFKWYVGINYLPEYSFTDLNKGDGKESEIIQNYEEIEHSKLSNSIGISLGRMYRNFVIETGVNYTLTQFNSEDKFGWNEINSIITTIYDTTEDIINTETGEHSYTIETSEIVNSETKEFSFIAQSNYKKIDIPLLVGYRIQKNKCGMAFKTGMITSLIISDNVDVTNTEGSPQYAFSKHKISDVSFSIVASAEYDHAITPRMHIRIAPVMKYPLNSLYKDNYPLTKKIFPVGLNFGVNYWL